MGDSLPGLPELPGLCGSFEIEIKIEAESDYFCFQHVVEQRGYL